MERLFEKPFSSRPFHEKLAIIKTGKPEPHLSLKTEVNDGKKKYFRNFRVQWYKDYSWLCGCLNPEKLYCWPCLLFNTKEEDAFGNLNQGIVDMSNFNNLRIRHEKLVSHVNAMISLVTFGKNTIESCFNKTRQEEITKFNEKVTQNRYILKCLIDVTCYLAQQEIAFRGHNEKVDSNNKGNYVELLNLLALRDEKLAHHLKFSTVFSGTSKTIQNELIQCISTVVKNEIKTEINKSTFVSIMLDETVDISKKSQLSTTVRYISDEHQAVERFIDFSDVSNARTAVALYNHITKFISEYECGWKLIAQTYDGAAVMAGQHNGLQKLMTDKYEQAQFVHCYAHQLNLVLKQSVNSIRECRVFFETLNGFSAFFFKFIETLSFFK